MNSLLIKNADVLVTMDGQRREITGGDLFDENGVVKTTGIDLPKTAVTIVDAAGCVVTPDLVNTHYHLFQTLTRVVPGGQDASLFGWLQTLYPIWARMMPEDIYLSAQLGLAILALSGCTMGSDHLYLFPN